MSGPTGYDYDLAVIGGGSSGYAAARNGGQAGLNTVLLEGGKEVGGLCILRGCMPTKALLYATEVLHQVRHASLFGIQTGPVQVDFRAMMSRKDRLIREFAEYRRTQLETGPFKFLRAHARFRDPHTLRLSTGETITARNFLICTGSVIAPPPLEPLSEIGCLTSDDALALTQLPKSLLILGGGAVAVEFAQFFVRLGVQVTLVQRNAQLLKEFDLDAAKELEKVFSREGMTVFTDTHLTDAWRDGVLKGVSFQHQGKLIRVAAEEILVALGRLANTATLGLEAAGVLTENQRIITNSEMQTSAPHIYAAGDCRGQHEIVHWAIEQAEIAVHNILHPEKVRRLDYRLLTSVIFTDPQIAQVGLNEKEASVQSLPFLAAKYPFQDHGKALIMEAPHGFVKLVAGRVSGEILGGTVVGLHGGESIHEIIAAISKRMTVHELLGTPHYHPTLAEIWTYPAEELALQIRPRG